MVLFNILVLAVIILVMILWFIGIEYYNMLRLQNVQMEEYLIEMGSKDIEHSNEYDEGIGDYEEELVYEDPEFDERIARLKDELIASNFPTHKIHNSTEAIVGAEGIYNIPHNEVDVYGGDEGIEISK